MNTPHTPGPWIKEGGTVCQVDTLQTICKTSGKDEAAQSANARLIAAAPELLEALQECVRILAEFTQYDDDDGSVEGNARILGLAAIAKANQH
jgi:hypothetical protein